MATYYVYSGAGGSGTGADWTNAYTTLTAAFSGHAAGDVYYVAHDHSESAASAKTLTSNGSLASPVRVICVNRSGSVPPVSADLRTTAIVQTTGANTITIAASTTYWYGIIFRAGNAGINTAHVAVQIASHAHIFKSCTFDLNNTSASSRIQLGNSAAATSITLIDCTFTFGATTQGINGQSTAGTKVTIIGGSMAPTGSVPTTLFQAVPPGELRLYGVDLSAFGSGKTLFDASVTTLKIGLLRNCKLGASVTVAATPIHPMTEILVVNSDSGDTNYRQEKYHFSGTMTTETTIVRTGGASDGTTPISWKIVTTADPEWFIPFECPAIAIWNESTGSSKTVTVYGVWGGGAVPLNDEIWIDVYALNTSGYPISSLVTTTKADILASGSNVTSDSSSWGGSTTEFKMQATFTPQEKGPFYIVVKAAKASSTFYIDPLAEVS